MKSFFKFITVTLLFIGQCALGQTDYFTDGNFTANPVWAGNNSNDNYAVLNTSPYATGGATTDGYYLASNSSKQNASLTTASTEVNEWRFSIGSPAFTLSSNDFYGIILMSNNQDTIDGSNGKGYYLRFGSASQTHQIELWKKDGNSNYGAKVGTFPDSPITDANALLAGLNIRVTRSNTGVFELFYSTGFTFSATPTTSAGTVTDSGALIKASAYFGLFQFFNNASDTRRVFLDNVVLGTSASAVPPVATAATNITTNSFTANWNAVPGATSYKLDVSTSPFFTALNSLAEWTFPTDGRILTPDSGKASSLNLNQELSTDGSTSISDVAGFKTRAATRTKWQYSGNDKYWQITINSMGFSNPLLISSIQRSSNTGPRDFQMQYKIGTTGSWVDIGTVQVANNWTSGRSNVMLPEVCNNQPLVLVRWKVASNKAVNNSDIASGGTSRIDNILVTTAAVSNSFVAGYDNKDVGNIGTYEVIGLLPETTYYYRVRAVSNNGTSANSNGITVVTKFDTTTWDDKAWDNGLPTPDLHAVISEDFNTKPSDKLISKSLTIDNTQTLTITAGSSFTTGNFINNGNLVVQSEANFVQTPTSVNSGTGSSSVFRDSNIKRLEYVYWSSSVQNQKLIDFSPKTVLTRFLTYNEGTDKFTSVNDIANATFIPAKGYAIRAPNNFSNTLASAWPGIFTGTLNNGINNFLLKYQSGITTPTEGPGAGYNLVGNPYASNINLEGSPGLFEKNKTVIASIAYFWNNRVANVGEMGQNYTGENYAVYNKAGGTPASGSTIKPTGIVKVGQGFIVKALPAGKDKNLVFDNANRSAATTDIFYDRQLEQPKDRFWIQLTTPSQDFNTMLIAYAPDATDHFELDYDAPLLGLSSDALFSNLDDHRLSIQGRKYPLNPNDVVEVGSNHFLAGEYKLSLQEAEGIFADQQNIYLKDKQTGAFINLSASAYSFSVSEGVTEGRFELVYQPESVLGTGTGAKENLIFYHAGNDFVLKSSQNISGVEVYDSSGRLMSKVQPNQKEVRLDASKLLTGMYILKITQAGKVVSKKIRK
ncbi:T9SS type A sorting domain-containing protein [Kaistella antarctica]|nr:T9SS type A sorting domain-containing protein [Kaistella antarctica]KEY18805.1 hypothetical protein HY04_10050 [Kaistella antarctica]